MTKIIKETGRGELTGIRRERKKLRTRRKG